MRLKPNAAFAFALLLLTAFTFAQAKKATKHAAGPGPDKAHLQKIWDAWSTLDSGNAAPFYASGPHVFFDIAPLSYSSWDEYQKGSAALVANSKSARFTVNDDSEFHPAGEIVWGTSTVKSDMVAKTGLHEMATFRRDLSLPEHRRQVAARPRAHLRTSAVKPGRGFLRILHECISLICENP